MNINTLKIRVLQQTTLFLYIPTPSDSGSNNDSAYIAEVIRFVTHALFRNRLRSSKIHTMTVGFPDKTSYKICKISLPLYFCC